MRSAIGKVVTVIVLGSAICGPSWAQGKNSAARRLPHGYRPQPLNQPKLVDSSASESKLAVGEVFTPEVTPASALVGSSLQRPGRKTHTMVAAALEPMDQLPSPIDTALGDEHVESAEPMSLTAAGTICEDGCCGSNGGGLLGHHGCGPHSGILLLPGLAVDHLSVFGGVQGVKGNANRGADGSFGFNEGLNIGTHARNIILPSSMGYQVGFRATQMNLEGTSFSANQRNQLFFTAGTFRRGDYGLQGGIAFDHLRDSWYYKVNVSQIRGELGMAINNRADYGFTFASALRDDTAVSSVSGAGVLETWETVDYYAIYVRSNWVADGAGEVKLMAGLTGDSDGILGAQSRLPLHNGWALESEFTYLVSDGGSGFTANELESWNVGINLAWYPGSLACGQCNRYHRPLFDVANNGSMILRRMR